MFDFYSLCAKYWVVPRSAAKARVIRLVLEAGGWEPDLADGWNPELLSIWSDLQFLNYTQPWVLDWLPMDARFEMLAHYGICLGEN